MGRKLQIYAHAVKSTETSQFPAVESKAGKPYWRARHDVTGSDRHYLPPYYYGLAVQYLKVPICSILPYAFSKFKVFLVCH